MKTHRVRSADPIDGKSRRHWFVEFKKDHWLETSCMRNWSASALHKAIHNLLKQEKIDNCFNLGFHTKAFQIGTVENWKEEESIKES